MVWRISSHASVIIVSPEELRTARFHRAGQPLCGIHSHKIRFIAVVPCTAAASLGCSIAGLAAGLLRIMTEAIFGETTPEDHRISSSVYFAIAVAVLMICVLAHYAIQKYKKELTVAFFQAEYAESTDSFVLRSDAIKRSIEVELSSVKEEEIRAAQAVEGGDECPNEAGNLGESFNFENYEQENDEGGRCKMHRVFSLFIEGSLVYREAFCCAWLPIIAQFVNFFITLSLFPGLSEYGGYNLQDNMVPRLFSQSLLYSFATYFSKY